MEQRGVRTPLTGRGRRRRLLSGVRSLILDKNHFLRKKLYVVAEHDAGQEDLERRISLYAQALRESGLRLTHQRLEVAREIARSTSHPDVETVYHAVRERVPTISLDTVYRTLSTLETLGLIRRLRVSGGAARYDPTLERHDHFVCTRCGLIQDVYGSGYEGLEPPYWVAEVGTVESVTVQLRGLCRRCQEADEGDEQ